VKKNIEVIILAAGQGSRMRSALPKVLHKVAGKPMLSHVIDSALALKPLAVHVVVGHGGDQVISATGDQALQWVRQQQQLGTGHAVAQAMPNVQADSLVLIAYADVPLVKTGTLEALLAVADNSTLALLTVVLEDPGNYGRIVRSDGEICAIVEEKDADAQQRNIDEINTGILAVNADKLGRWLPQLSADNAQGEFYLTDIIAMAVADGMRVQSCSPASAMEVEGVNNRMQLAAVERYYQQQQAYRLMMAGATLADPDRIDVRGELVVGEDVFIDINCVFIGAVSLAAGVSIGPNCVIEESTIGAGTTIKANSVLEQASVAANGDIGPFARLRPGAVLAENVKIGNFVEVKNTQLAAGSKANHLAYLGDAVIGKGCNIGAGTITCNYDGAFMHKTTLGDDVFIGSNSTLVAPITIADGAFVGAGSTVTKTIEANQLAVGRGKQRNIDGWKKPVKS
jgi:bifunctional UDP-N-acetylglucosamine pyrophosphorylase/glucosamine-1-phosphate N-acetyltransferase